MNGVYYNNRLYRRGAELSANRFSATGRYRTAAMLSCSIFVLAGLAMSARAQTYETDVTSNTTLTAPITVLPGYTQVTYGIGNGATLTLGAGSDPTSTFYVKALNGGGTLVNNTTITTTGPAIVHDGYSFTGKPVDVTNNGTIQAAVSSGYAITAGNGRGNLINTGTITATGAGAAVFADVNGNFKNSGTVTADGTAVYAFDNVSNTSNNLVTNSGTIHSNNAVGFYGWNYEGINSGTIYGKTVGAQIMGRTLTNSGAISSPNIAVSVDGNGTLVNTASGVVNGNIGAVFYGFTYSGKLRNAGTINGNVDFGTYSNSRNTVILLPGSVINGNLTLGGGNDTFITSAVNTGPGQYAGITGTLTAAGADTSTIRYYVASDATLTSLAQPTAFGTVKYDLSNNAKLNVTAPSSPLSSIGFSGTGSVDIAANITGNGYRAIFDLTETSPQMDGSGTPNPTVLNFTSRGTLTQIVPPAYPSSYSSAVRLTNGNTFTNAGTIIAQNNYSQYLTSPRMAAIFGGGTVINNGTINLVGVDGISQDTSVGGAPPEEFTVYNNGTIQQTGDGHIYSRGVIAATIVNTGTIKTGGEGVTLYRMSAATSLTNSGNITSTMKDAVLVPTYAYGASSIVNQAGGVISGATIGVNEEECWWCYQQRRVLVSNAGTISGGNYGISLADGGSVVNSGVITGVLDAIWFGNRSTLTLQTGSNLIGNVEAAADSSSTLILQGSGTEDSTFLNFSTLDMQGPGTWTLSGTNAIDATRVSGGALVITGSLTSTYTIDNGATLQGSTATLLTSAAVTNNGTLVFDQSSDGTFSQAITGTGTLVKAGTGALTLTAANTYGGGTTISAGALIASSDSVLGATTGGLTLAGGTLRFAGQFDLAATRGMVLGAGGGTIDTNGFDTALRQTVSGTGGLTKSGLGTLTFSAANTYTGATTIQSGTLALAGNGSIAASSGVIDNATFDISTTNTGTTVQALSGNGVVVLGGKTLTISNASGEFSGKITGSGALALTGGSEILSGDSSYTGGTTVATGATLQIGNGGSAGWIVGNVIDNGVLVFDRSDDVVFAGDISGTGGVSFTGTGRVTLAGHNTYTGKLGIGSGAIVHISDIGSVTGDIANNGTLDFDSSSAQRFASNISGSGNLTLTGGGTLTLTGNNTYTGNTVITAGMLSISSDANLGNGGTLVLANGTGVILTGGGTFNHPVTVAGDPVFNVVSGTAATWAGQISDGSTPGDVEVTGGGTLILTAANSYTGGTTIQRGSMLQLGNGGTTGSVVGTIANNGTLAINRSDNLASSNAITGTGGVVKSGTNTLTLNAANTYTGATTVAAGRLVVGDAAHATAAIDSRTGGVTVANGASLSGFGTIAGAVTNNGTLVTGQSSGSLTVGGLTQSSSGTLAVELSPSASSHLTVTGAANLGGTLSANFTAGSSTPHLYSVLSAASINGTFANVTTSGAATGMVYATIYAPREVDVIAAPETVGQIYGDLRTATFDTAFALNGMVMDRLGDCPSCSSWSFWTRGVLSTARTDSNGSAAGFDNDLTGVMGGIDYHFENGISTHAAVGYASSDLTLKGFAEKASTSSIFVSLAGHAPVAGFEIDGSFFYMQNSTDLTRDTQIAGLASSKPDSSTFGFGVKAGYPLLGGDLVPQVRLSYATVNQSTTEETGASVMDLALAGNDTSELRGDIGAKLRHRFTTGDIVLVPEVKLFLDQALSTTPNHATVRFAGVTSGFDSPAAKADRTAALIGAGLTGEFGNGLAINIALDSRIGSKQTEMIGSFGLSWQF